jgi:hypothetical protein
MTANLSDAAKRGRRFADPERHTRLGGRLTRPHHGRQPRRINEREPAGFDGRCRLTLDRFAHMCPELLGAAYVEFAHNDDGGTGAVLPGIDIQHVSGKGFNVVRHMALLTATPSGAAPNRPIPVRAGMAG